MQLIKQQWSNSNKKEFLEYLTKFKRDESKCIWEKNIVNTKYECLAILSKNIKNITKEIYKGNYISFLNLQIYNNFPAITIMGHLICKIKDIEIMKHYLDLYSMKVDNWSNCDQLKFNVNNTNKSDYLNIVYEYINSPLPFRRRIAIIIMFNFINNTDINKVFELANSLSEEDHYYVNMANAWLLCECFIKCKEQTISFLKTHKLNNFTIIKMISKCIDSFRISSEDKNFLKTYKITNIN